MPKINFFVVILVAGLGFCLVIGTGFMATRISGGTWLDFTFTAEQTRNLFTAYSPQDIAFHKWMTSHIGLMTPIVLAAFAITMFHYSLGAGVRTILVSLAVWGSAVDYVENFVIISLLEGGDRFEMKAYLTNVKFALILIPQTVALYLFLKQAKSILLGTRSLLEH